MRLHASIRPPAPVAHHLAAALGPELATAGQVNWIHPSHWRLHLAGFGSVVQGDALRLADLLSARVAEIEAPTLRLSGLVALPEDGDDSIWVEVAGDLEPVADLAATLPRWVYEFGFVLDRRVYRPRIQVGKVTTVTTASYLEGLVGRLGGYAGDTWTADGITLGHQAAGSAGREPWFDVLRVAYFAGQAGPDDGNEDSA